MELIKNWLTFLLILTTAVIQLKAQEGEVPQQVISKQGFEKSAPAVVKLVADEGKMIGAGVIIGVHEEDVGFVLTSYKIVAGRDKLAVILKDYPDPLLGVAVEKWIDFDSDLAIVAIKDFPPNQPVICLQEKKSFQVGESFTILGHTEVDDWMPIPKELTASNERHLVFSSLKYSGIAGGPILNKNGNMIGLVISGEEEETGEENLTLGINTSVIKPIIKDWFQPIQLRKRWCEKGAGLATWIWAVGGGVLGGGIATAIAVVGGGAETPRGLPRPPEPPK